MKSSMDTTKFHQEIRPLTLYAIFSPIKYLFFALVILIGSYFLKPYLPEEQLKIGIAIIVSIFLLIYIMKYLHIKSIVYTITEDQIKYKRGLFTITTDYIEMYRILDFTEVRTFLLRFISGMSFSVETTDKTHPSFVFSGIPKSNIDQYVRNLVEDCRSRKRVLVTE